MMKKAPNLEPSRDPMKKKFDPAALGSDVPRTRRQYWARRAARTIVTLLRLNSPSVLTTEIVQAINPIATIDTRDGPLFCRAGHGRLLWRARSFFEEEPETIAWLDRLSPTDVFWDIGSNVGLYAIYAAKFRKCQSLAFEPESQNYALLLENIALNEVGGHCLAASIALTKASKFGRLRVRYLTKGGAFNHFSPDVKDAVTEELPESFRAAQSYEFHRGFEQLIFGCSVDDLVFKHGLPIPSFLKIDVDGLEPQIISGAVETLKRDSVKSLLVELNARSTEDMAVPKLLSSLGFKHVGQRSNWLSREDKTRENDLPAVNMIFERV